MSRTIISIAKYLVALLGATFCLFLISLYFLLPWREVSSLRQGHYINVIGQIDKSRSEFNYVITDARPSNWLYLDEISPHVAHAIIVSEDWTFYEHRGLDFEQIKSAIDEYLSQQRVRGASTITQQVVKNLFFSHRQTFLRKILESIVSLYFDFRLEKDRILEIYLNIAHFGSNKTSVVDNSEFNFDLLFGRNIYGVHLASNYYFSKAAKELSPRESAFLAMLLPSPNRYSVSFYQGELTEFAGNRVYNILNLMRVRGFIDSNKMTESLSRAFEWERFLVEIEPFRLDSDLRQMDYFDFYGRDYRGHSLIEDLKLGIEQ